MQPAISLLVDCRNQLGECPIWDAAGNRLLWCDIVGRQILSRDMADGALQRWDFPGRVGSFGLCESGRFIVAMEHGIYFFDPATGARSLIAEVETDLPHTRLNDGKVGPDGAFWVGTMDDRPERQPIAALYRVAPDGTVEKKIDGLRVSNGLAWSADGRTMFHSDSRAAFIDAWDFDAATGAIGNRQRIRTLDDTIGRPDGAACDMENGYWSAGVSAGTLNRFSPSGEHLLHIKLPTPAPTMPCFGGPDMRTLFVTGLRSGQPAEALAKYPDAGGILTLRVDIPGVPVGKFHDV